LRFAEFDAFCNALGAKQLSFGLYVVPKFSSPPLYVAWCNGNRKYLGVDLHSAF
jgi:hypothetical protein